MDASVLGGLLGGASSMIGAFVNADAAERINYSQMQLAKYQMEKERELIQEQNEYNSPKNQMARYIEAGLNPNLIYGNGQSSAGNQSGIARYEAPKLNVPYLDMSGVISAIMNIRKQNQELENMKEQQFLLRSERMAKDIENMYQATITGFDPGLVSSQEERDMVLGGMRIGRYKTETSGLESLRSLREANVALAKLDARQKDWVYKNMNDLTLKLASLDIESKTIANDVNAVLGDYEKRLHSTFGDNTAYIDKILDVISNVISIFVPKISFTKGNVGKTAYQRKSVTYP